MKENDFQLHSAFAIGQGSPHGLPGGFSRQLRRADTLTISSVRAVYHCLERVEQAGLSIVPERCAIVAGFGLGTLETNLSFVDSLYEDGSGAGSPTLFSHSVHNTVVGYVSRLFGIHGPSFTLTAFEWPFLSAIQQARSCLESGLADMALVLGCEVESRFMKAVHAQFAAFPEEPRWQTGALAWFIAAPGVFPPMSAAVIRGPELNLRSCKPEELLLRLSESYPGREETSSGVPFGYALSLNITVSQVLLGSLKQALWEVHADFGMARLGVGM